ncbi:MAG: DUF2993 domain-containing protein [Phormidesmis priestleyi]|uniref:DUF2993 domain-containing protein n=1 Tax=Phormidesmis priestleyi TaxID=268141 RepID=A0A2W4XK92_9CYAN|nr:MAG: DUF2993 domain-containing protein [Phormidesmis priestleyi]
MELITVILSSLLLIISPIGIVVDQVAENAIRSRLAAVESLDVRVDNGSSFNLLQGRVDRVRIAGRGVSPVPGLRIAAAELETDPIDLEFASLRRGEVVLDQPLQGAIRLVLNEADINAFLASPEVVQRLAQIKIGSLNQAQSRERDRYKIKDPAIEFLTGETADSAALENRIRVTLELEDLVQASNLQIEAEVSLSISAGDRLTLINPILSANGSPVPPQLINAVLSSLNEQLSLSRLDQRGITARVLNFTIQPQSLELAFWIRVDPSVTAATVPAAAALQTP